MNLTLLRQEIDLVNHQIIQLLAERVKLAREIARVKKRNGLPIEDRGREREQYRALHKEAHEVGLDPTLIEKMFFLIVEYSKNRMHEEG